MLFPSPSPMHTLLCLTNAQAVSSEQAMHVSRMEEERDQLSHQLDEIRAELETFKSQVVTEKKEALEQ